MPCGPEAVGHRSPQEVALYVEAGVPSKLSGCETIPERSLYKALHELCSASRPPAALMATLYRLWR